MAGKDSGAQLAAFEQNAKKPFGMTDKIGYAFGDFANNLTFVITALFMMKFYTDIMGVSAALVGLMMMLAKVVDAFTDVGMGQICDRSRYTAQGKFKPWMLRFSIPVGVAGFLIFAPYLADAAMGIKIFWMFFTYLLWGSVCYTGVNIPYGSMASAMSDKPEERQSLSTWRNVGATVGQIVIAVILPMVVYTTDAEGHKLLSGNKVMISAFVCAVLAIISYFACYRLSTERIKLLNDKEHQKSTGQLFGLLLRSRAFIGIIVAALILLITQLVLTGMGSYIYPNYFNNTVMQSMSALLGCAIVLVLSTFVSKLSDTIGKKELSALGAVIGAVALFITYVIHTHNVVVYVVLYSIAYTGLGFFNLVCWAMIIDVIDDIQIRTGVRSDGTVYSVYSFARKLGQAASSGLTGAILAAIGYTKETAFDPGVVNKIYDTAALIPAIGFILMALALMFLYPLSKKQVLSNAETLRKNRS